MKHKNKNEIAIFLAARSGSKRLKDKHFLKIKPSLRVIDLCILRLKKTKFVDKIFLCTTKNKEDNKFQKICNSHNIGLFRGSTNNVAKRIIDCALKNSIKVIVRITADCPLIDPKIIDQCVKKFFIKKTDYASNIIKLSYPDGLDVEVLSLKKLIKSQNLSNSKYNQEHVTPFIIKSKKFKKFSYVHPINFSNRRWTLDTIKDFLFLKKVIRYFSPNIYFSWKDLIKAEKHNKSLINIKNR